MEILIEILILQTVGEMKSEIRRQNERIARLEQWQTRLKAACAGLATWCACLRRGIYGR